MLDIIQLGQRLTLFQEMIRCCHELYLWQYDGNYQLIGSNCPQEALVRELFAHLRNEQLVTAQMVEQDTPVLLTNDVGLMWIVQPLIENGTVIRLFILGPVFLDAIPSRILDMQLTKYDLDFSQRVNAQQFLGQLPVISLGRIFEYAIMLHFCVTGQTIGVSDLRYDEQNKKSETSPLFDLSDSHGTYEDEREMLRMVREGDITHFRAQMDKLSITGRLGQLSNGDPLRQMKTAVMVCLTLFSRAAMEGGLSPEVSYALSDRYFQSIEACKSISELVDIAIPMQEDYVQRVHDCRNSQFSKPVQAVCDYIDLHLEEHLDLALLAREAGYAEYYLSRKFKKETGQSVSDYIRNQRLERAAHLLRTTKEDAQKIGARLQFSSQSHFTECFRKRYGITPSAYRNE